MFVALATFLFQYPHRIVGGFKLAMILMSCWLCFAFQYPHRIVGGFKNFHPGRISRDSVVSVSSSDRRGVQVFAISRSLPFPSVSVSSSDRRGVQVWRSRSIRISSPVSVSSSDRRGVQDDEPPSVQAPCSVSVSSSDRRGVQADREEVIDLGMRRFSILIGSSGGSSSSKDGSSPR